jgi:hypothetical protein
MITRLSLAYQMVTVSFWLTSAAVLLSDSAANLDTKKRKAALPVRNGSAGLMACLVMDCEISSSSDVSSGGQQSKLKDTLT